MEGLEIINARIVDTDTDDILDEVIAGEDVITVSVQIGYKKVIADFTPGRYNRITLINQVISTYFPEFDEEAL